MPEPGETRRAFAELTTWLDERLAAIGVPGATFGVVVGDQVFTHAYGVGRIDSSTPVSSATRFRIASLTKVFTAAAVAQLADAGEIDLQQPVRDILPGFRVADAETSAAVTVAHLLSHNAGWADALDPDTVDPGVPDPDTSDPEVPDPGAQEEPLARYVDRMRELDQVAPVGRFLSYSNSGYVLAGHLLATISGSPYEDVVRSQVIDRLGLVDTGFVTEGPGFGPAAADAGGQPSFAYGHAMGDDGPVLVDASNPARAANPAYGLLSSVDDLLAFLKAQLRAAREGTAPFAGMLQPLGSGGSLGPTLVDRVALGWMLRDVDGHLTALSQGSDAGYCAGMAFVPADDFGLVVLTNSEAALMLVNDTLWQGVTHFLGATVATPKPVEQDAAEIESASGTFALWDGMTFEVRSGTDGVAIVTTVHGDPVPPLTGPLTVVDREHGFMAALGGRVWFDFVRSDHGTVDWLRFAGRLAPRVGRSAAPG